ncbi:MAG TPA: multiheme c-type cytochrome [Parafilimonas sp.]|nr:multiheme c-type cytochrome [Parafilimonas sp.]
MFTKCVSDQTKKRESIAGKVTASQRDTVEFSQFAGAAVCAKCHASIVNDYAHTAHFLSSQPASDSSIKGSFKKGQNSFKYDFDKIVSLEKQNNSFYQTYYYHGKKVVKRRFDIVIGSGTKGQTYLSWLDAHLIELPVSYFTQVHQWANSPGYPLSPIIFNRPVTTRCLECHSTYAGTINYHPDIPPVFDSTKMLLTIGCEKCHGPAAKHVAYQLQNPGGTTAKLIINPTKLSRQLALDVCGLCHSGRLEEKSAPFQFTPGKSLSNYFQISDAAKRTGVMDVHGNQLGILSLSKCFRISKTMTCLTCHAPHKNERNNTATFSQRCISCHSDQHKTIEGVSNDMLINNCIDCHMPLQESTSISFLLQGKEQPVNATMRTHFIKVYNDETKKFIEHNASSQKKKS